MDGAKIQLSASEMALVSDPDVILTKNSIMSKAVALMADLSEAYRPLWEDCWLDIYSLSPKIARGENYLGLPYVMLDFPRLFGKEDTFAIRTMFWWGNGFQLILHVKGRYLDLLLPVIQQNAAALGELGFQYAVTDNEWAHEMTEETYRPLTPEAGLTDVKFLKLAAPLSLDDWNQADELLPEMFRRLVDLLVA